MDSAIDKLPHTTNMSNLMKYRIDKNVQLPLTSGMKRTRPLQPIQSYDLRTLIKAYRAAQYEKQDKVKLQREKERKESLERGYLTC